MTGRWDRLQELFDQAVEMAPSERRAFLDRACPDDPELCAEVDQLVEEHDRAPDFLDRPIAKMAEALDAPVEMERSYGPYRVVRLLGTGGMGEVYLAMDTREDLHRPVAVKVIRRDMGTEDVLRRFRMERRILASLRHPNIARLLDGGLTDDGLPFLVMEYVEGEPIAAYCDRTRLTVGERLALFRSVCDAVQHAHRNLVVHRDLKPSNVLVTGEGIPKLMDFGIAELVDSERERDRSSTVARTLTPGYASPEQLRGDVVGVASDVYQLGLLLFELVTGRRAAAVAEGPLSEGVPRPSTAVGTPSPTDSPASGGTDSVAVAERRRTRPRRLRGRLSGDVDALVLKALDPEPDGRYPSAAALADDIGRHLDGRPVQARAPTLSYRTGKFVLRNRWAVGAAAVVLASLTWATEYSVAQSRQVASERDRAVEVQDFLLEMFGATGPNQVPGDSVTVREILDRQAQALATTYLDRPRLRARMMDVLADGYDRLGLDAAAEPLAREALSIRRKALGDGDPEVGEAVELLGWVLHHGGQKQEGDSLLARAVPMLREARPKDPKGLARALNDLGVAREASGDYDAAADLYREALDLRRGEGGEKTRAYAVTASNLSVILYRKADYKGAVAMAEEALAAMRASVGPDHQRSIIIQSNLAAMKLAQGDSKGAEEEYRNLLARETRIQGADHPVTVRVRTALAQTLLSEERWADAEPLYRQVLAVQEKRLGTENPGVAPIKQRLAEALAHQGKGKEALPLARDAVRLERGAYGDHDPRVAQGLERLSDVLGLLDRHDEAEAEHREALRIYQEKLGPDHPATAAAAMRFGHRLLIDHKYAEALELLTGAEHVLASHFPGTNATVVYARLHLAQAEVRTGHPHLADSILALAHEGMAKGNVLPDPVPPYDSIRAEVDDSLRRGGSR